MEIGYSFERLIVFNVLCQESVRTVGDSEIRDSGLEIGIPISIMEAHNDHMSPITQPGAPAVGQLDEAKALAIVRGVTTMIVNCKDFLVFPNTSQWKDITSRVDVVEQKLDSLAVRGRGRHSV
ncbi:hypothetical protein E4U13_003425 [Claviceps humidiphila]|uniref:Uncharacterized protein n=1 Tax=Claviceps humidiphila TaxID=1294629 RepID=A0A9P7PXJ1_9HYPO|nr:hypothetical protein E4U13_003425 [Claviceps humidiphila]